MRITHDKLDSEYSIVYTGNMYVHKDNALQNLGITIERNNMYSRNKNTITVFNAVSKELLWFGIQHNDNLIVPTEYKDNVNKIFISGSNIMYIDLARIIKEIPEISNHIKGRIFNCKNNNFQNIIFRNRLLSFDNSYWYIAPSLNYGFIDDITLKATITTNEEIINFGNFDMIFSRQKNYKVTK